MKKISIIGFGRFGRTLARLLQDDFEIVAFDNNPAAFKNLKAIKIERAKTLEEALSASVIFYAVPISQFEKILQAHSPLFRPEQLLIDVLSVKMHPAQVFKKILTGANAPRAMLTHPMFGPDSSKNGFAGLPIVTNRLTATAAEYQFWNNCFAKKGLAVIKLTPQEHDRLAARSQGVAHFMGRLLQEFKFAGTPIDTQGAKKLQELQEQISHDTWELFRNLQAYNPYTKQMRIELGRSYDKLYNQILPRQVKAGTTVFGIQGGVGSFNEQAIREYIASRKIKNFEIKYLYTSERVLKELHEGNIDFGLFAIQNAIGGVVAESITALTRYKCQVVTEFPILIRHFLMKRKDNPLAKPLRIMAHDQVFRQCHGTLKKKFATAKLITGTGDLKDTARAAQALADSKVDKKTFILGPKILASIYNFDIVASDLQDNKQNLTTFLLVKR